MLELYILLSFLFAFLIFFLTRDLAYLFFSFCYLFIYMFDAWVSINRGALYMSPSNPFISVSRSSLEDASLMIFSSYLIYSFVFLICKILKQILVTNRYFLSNVQNNDFFTKSNHVSSPKGIRKLILIFLMFLPVIFTWFVINNGLGVNPIYFINVLMSNRGLIFNDNLLATVTLYILPGMSVAAFYICFYTNQPNSTWRAIFFIVFTVLSFLCILTGSRSAFMFNLFVPLIVFSFYKGSFLITKVTKSHIVMLIAGPIIIFSLIQFSNFYRDATRGAQNEESFFISPDVVQFDALSIIIENDLTGHNTYLAAFTFPIPRTYWENKPVSGNRIFSENLYGDRLEITGAEMTSSLLGEAYINFGLMGSVSAAIILSLITLVTSAFLRSENNLFRLLGLVFLFRGVNFIRGDLLNTVVPLFFTIIIIFFVNKLLIDKKFNFNKVL